MSKPTIINPQTAKKIIRRINNAPSHDVDVNWPWVVSIAQEITGVKTISRQTLYRYKENGVQVIQAAYEETIEYQRKLKKSKESLPYKNSPRTKLREMLIDREAKIAALEEQLRKLRAEQYDQLEAFVTNRLSPTYKALVANRGE